MSVPRQKPNRFKYAALLVVVLGLGVIAWNRTGLFELPRVPPGLSLSQAGLEDLEALRRMDDYVWGRTDSGVPRRGIDVSSSAAIVAVRDGIAAIGRNEVDKGFALVCDGVRSNPQVLVLGNAYRIVVFQLQRACFREARLRGDLSPQLPAHLTRQPLDFLTELARTRPTRETRLQVALAWVDQMLLFPALEIKAPASVESVKILTGIIDDGNAGYVPALFARGLNHLHRPARLVWPEATQSGSDAALRDIGLCIAIGRHFDVGSARLRATLALALGDAHVKADKFDKARSWWQVAQGLCADSDLQGSVRRRFAWHDDDILDLLEAELDGARADLDRPLTDLSVMWN